MIFNLLKSKPTLKELIPNGFVDIHSHILPGIDDGAKNIKESLELISEMKKLGFSKIIGTPHTYPNLYNNTTDTIRNSYNLLISNLKDEIVIDYASEYLIENGLIEKAKKNELLCLKENYLLVEMSFMSAPLHLSEIIFELVVNGYKPVLAHPERYIFFYEKFEKFHRLKEIGCMFQINLLSATNYYGKQTRKILDKLLENKLVDFVGSDIHRKNHILQFDKKIRIKNISNLQKAIECNNIFNI